MSFGRLLTRAHEHGEDGPRLGRSVDDLSVSSSVLLLAACCAFVVVAGCEEGRLQVNPVHGQVTYKGQGVSNATVIFFPTGPVADQLQKMRPYAYADENGRFSLKTYVTGDGAPAGQYRVGIIAVVGSDRENNDGLRKQSTALPRLLTQKYANHETSGIEVTVEPGKNDLKPFELR